MRNREKLFLFAGVLTALMALTVTTSKIVFGNYDSFSRSTAGVNDYVLTLNSSNVPASITENYQNSVAGTVNTANGNELNFTFVNAKQTAGGFVQLAPRGMIYNFNTGNKQVTAVEGIKFTGSGYLAFLPAIGVAGKGAILADVAPTVIAAGSEIIPVPACDYFALVAADGGATIESLQLSYSCDANQTDIKLLNGTYTGIGDDDSTYKLVVSDGDVVIDTLDRATNLHLEGTVEWLTKTRAKCTYVYNTYNIYYIVDVDGHNLTFVSKSDDVGGAVANEVAEVSFTRVYNVEDFQSYSATGQGYTNATTKYQTSGLRAAIYADYYTGSNSSEIGGSGWQLMTSTDNTTLLNTKGHNGTKGAALKFSNGSSMRYISMNELYGVPSIIGVGGQKLSFWARGAYTNTNFNTNYAKAIPMKAYAYFAPAVTPGTQTSVRTVLDFTVQPGDEWQHFELPLEAGKTYYGFGLWAQQSTGSTAYVPFDDFEVYGASPYATYVAPVAVTGVTVAPDALELETGAHNSLTATVAPNDATNKEVTWSSDNESVATVSDAGVVTAHAVGNATITATTSDGGFTDTCAVTVVAPSLDKRPEGTYKGTATVLGSDYQMVIALGNATNNLVAVMLANKDAVATSATYNSGTKQLTITTTGSYSTYSYGNITGTYDPLTDSITNISCSGSISTYVSNNGSITATTASGSFYDCDGTTSELQSLFKRRWGDSWTVDTTNADRFTSDTTNFVSGTGAVKRRGYTGGRVAMNFNSDFSPAVTAANVQFWVYNPSANDITLRMWGYKAVNFGSNFETGSVTAKANGWTYCAMGFTSAAIYNFQIADFNNTGVYLTFDNIYLF